MKKKQFKIIITCIISLILIGCMKVYAASMGMRINKSSGYIGDTFTVTISGINGRVNITSNSNVSLNITGSQWVDGSLTITGTAKGVGTGTITVTPVDASTTAAEPEEVTKAETRSITIKEKEPEPTTPTNPTPTTPTPSQTTTTPKKTNTNTNKTTTPKTEEPKEEKQDDFYINKVGLTGVKEDGEKVDISLSPEFQRDIYEYTCHVGAEIEKLELEKEAGDYTNSIIVTGLEELKEGENIITLQLSAEDHEAKTYTIKVIKEKQEEIETVATVEKEQENNNSEQSKTKMISMPLWVFIVMQIFIIIIEVLAIYFIPWKNLLKKKIDVDSLK